MNRMLWSIVIIGFLTVVFLVLAMWVMLGQFGASPYSSSSKIAYSIRGEFHFESVGTATRYEGLKNVFLVAYETHLNSNFNLAAQNAEMQKVAEYAATKFEPGDRRRVDEIQVKRTEIHGSGCFQQSYVAGHSIPNPYRNVLPAPRQP
jgi:hypothetical protein